MTIEDIRIHTSWYGHLKRKKLRRRYGAAGVEALQNLWLYAGLTPEHRGGSFHGLTAEDLALACELDESIDPEPFFADLASSDLRLLDGEPGAYEIHDWADWQPHVFKASNRSRLGRENVLRRYHNEGRHDEEPCDDCPVCADSIPNSTDLDLVPTNHELVPTNYKEPTTPSIHPSIHPNQPSDLGQRDLGLGGSPPSKPKPKPPRKLDQFSQAIREVQSFYEEQFTPIFGKEDPRIKTARSKSLASKIRARLRDDKLTPEELKAAILGLKNNSWWERTPRGLGVAVKDAERVTSLALHGKTPTPTASPGAKTGPYWELRELGENHNLGVLMRPEFEKLQQLGTPLTTIKKLVESQAPDNWTEVLEALRPTETVNNYG